jgi:hypothetical protein
MKEWIGGLERAVRESQAAGHLQRNIVPAQLAFEINALEMGANWAFKLYGDPEVFARARGAILERLQTLATRTAPALIKRGKRRAVA